MFTGIIIEMGEVLSLTKKAAGGSIAVRSDIVSSDASIGDSISINGVCLTVIEKKGSVLSFDISEETMDSTNLGKLQKGQKVNLEPSLRPDGKIGGHFVTGHVDGVGTIRSKNKIGDAFKIVISAPEKITGLLVEKGSVAVDGISLTVVDISDREFSVVIIPHTANVTTMGFKGPGDTVNLEADIIGKYIARFLKKDRNIIKEQGLMRALTEAGFIT